MTPNCLLLDNQSETFLVQILIYKKWKNESAETIRKGTRKKLKAAKEASLPFLTRGTPNNLQTLQKFKVPDVRDISVILTTPHRHSPCLDILSSYCEESKHRLFVIFCLTNVFQ